MISHSLLLKHFANLLSDLQVTSSYNKPPVKITDSVKVSVSAPVLHSIAAPSLPSTFTSSSSSINPSVILVPTVQTDGTVAFSIHPQPPPVKQFSSSLKPIIPLLSLPHDQRQRQPPMILPKLPQPSAINVQKVCSVQSVATIDKEAASLTSEETRGVEKTDSKGTDTIYFTGLSSKLSIANRYLPLLLLKSLKSVVSSRIEQVSQNV